MIGSMSASTRPRSTKRGVTGNSGSVKPGVADPRPPDRVADAVGDAEPRLPAQHHAGLVDAGVRAHAVTGTRRRLPYAQRLVTDRLERRHELAHGGAGPGAEVDHFVAPLATGRQHRVELTQRGDMGQRKVPDVDVVADPGAIAGGPVGAGERELVAVLGRADELPEQVGRLTVRQPGAQLRVGPDRV